MSKHARDAADGLDTDENDAKRPRIDALPAPETRDTLLVPLTRAADGNVNLSSLPILGTDLLHARRTDAKGTFRWLFVGVGTLGKTRAAIEHMAAEHAKLPFDRLVVISPTILLEDGGASGLGYDAHGALLAMGIPTVEFHEELNKPVLEKLLADQAARTTPNRVLLFVDQCDTDPLHKSQYGPFVEIIGSGWHLGISVVLVAWQLTRVNWSMLMHADGIGCFFQCGDAGGYKGIARQFLSEGGTAAGVRYLRRLVDEARRRDPVYPYLGIVRDVYGRSGNVSFHAKFGPVIDQEFF